MLFWFMFFFIYCIFVLSGIGIRIKRLFIKGCYLFIYGYYLIVDFNIYEEDILFIDKM